MIWRGSTDRPKQLHFNPLKTGSTMVYGRRFSLLNDICKINLVSDIWTNDYMEVVTTITRLQRVNPLNFINYFRWCENFLDLKSCWNNTSLWLWIMAKQYRKTFILFTIWIVLRKHLSSLSSNISSIISSNSEAFASELLERLEKMFLTLFSESIACIEVATLISPHWRIEMNSF